MVVGTFIFHLNFSTFDPSGVSPLLSSFSPVVIYRPVHPILKHLKIFMEEIHLTLGSAEMNAKHNLALKSLNIYI